MTELDPNIILRAGQYQGPDFAQTLGQVANLKAQAGQQQVQQMQLAQLTRQNAAADAKTAALRGAVGPDGKIDYGKIKSALVQSGDVEGAMGIDTTQASQQKAQLELQGKRFDRGLQLIGSVFDQSSLDRARAQAIAEGLPTESIPEVYDPEKLGQLFKAGLTAKERIDAELAASKFGFEKGKDSRDFNYRASNDAAGRAVTMRGQNMADARAKDALEEKKNGALSQDAVMATVAQLRAGDTSALMNIGRGTQGATNIAMVKNALAAQLKAEGLTGADVASANAKFFGTKAGARTLGTSLAKTDYGINELAAATPLAMQSLTQVPNGSFVPFNILSNTIQRGGGSAEQRDFAVKTQAVINAYNIIAGRAGSSVDERAHNTSLLTTADSPQAYRAALAAMAQEGETAKAAAEQTMRETTGGRAPPAATVTRATSKGPKIGGVPSDIAAILAKHGSK